MTEGAFRPGLYRHYKGGLYLALFIATHSETEAQLVVYVPYEHPESGLRVRDLVGPNSWTEVVEWRIDPPPVPDSLPYYVRKAPRFERVEGAMNSAWEIRGSL